MKYDFPYPGALEFTHYAEKNKIPITYLTARDQIDVYKATCRQLSELGFPSPEGITENNAILMERTHTSAKSFKYEELQKLSKQIDYGVFIDNEVGNLEFCASEESNISGYVFDSVHSGRDTDEASKFQLIPHW